MWLNNYFNLPFPLTAFGFGKKSKFENFEMAQDEFLRATNIALNMYEWVNLPKTCDPEKLEETLYFYGKALFFEDKKIGDGAYFHTAVDELGDKNIYNRATKFQASAGNGYREDYTIDNSVLILNNQMKYATVNTISIYSHRIADIQRTIDVHARSLKRPRIIACDESEKLSIKNALKQMDENEETIVSSKAFKLDTWKYIDSHVTSYLKDLCDYKVFLENEKNTFLGINNTNVSKKERLLTDEVDSNNDNVRTNLQRGLDSRKKACEQINEMFGLNIDVKVKNEMDIMEGKEDGEIHNGTGGDN